MKTYAYYLMNLKIKQQAQSINSMETQQTSSLRDFDILKKLGEGAFGQVFLVRRKADSQTYALKKVKLMGLKTKQKENALNEIRILASLNDQYIVKFKEAFFDSDFSYLCIIMEYASGGDILKMIQTKTRSRTRIQQSQIWKALVDILKGLKSLHTQKILHRDLKCANIFIDGEGKYKLGDLNVSKVLKKGLAYTQTGTPYYASPQVWQDLPYDMKSDMWSLGCVIYEMAALQPPFKAQDLQGLFKKVKQGKFKPISTFYSNQLSEIITLLLKVKPKDRPDTQALLKNPFVKKRAGMKLEQFDYNELQSNDLLKTIKFNSYNLKALKNNLPKSSYGNHGETPTVKQRERKDSLDSLDFTKRERVLSACGIRRERIGQSPSYNRKQPPKIPQQPPPIPSRQGPNLPPRPQKKSREEGCQDYPYNNRLRRVGEDILSGRNRSSSVNR